MKRAVFSDLIAWKNNPKRKPLLLWGARQVGKTWLMREFGRSQFQDTVYISFYNNKRMASVFEDDFDIKRIVNYLEIELHKLIKPESTLIIFDEIQNAPKVLESLKYFCEEANEYYVMAAGSLLGVALHEDVSFPVGKVDELQLYPMSFREFLWAMEEEKLAAYIEVYHNPEVNSFHEIYADYLKQYLVVGGMPEVVDEFRQNRDYDAVREIQLSILHQYEGDFGKHVGTNELPRIRMVWNSLPGQLAKENKKFFFGQIKKGARAKEYEIAIQWLVDAGLIYKVNKVSKPAMPLKSYVDPAAFKIFMLDVGLLGALSELDYYSVLRGNEIFSEFKGALTEQYVFEQLKAETSHSLFYYASEKSTYEIDFLYQDRNKIIPLEVKAGTNLSGKSLKMFCDKFDVGTAVKTSMANYQEQDWMRNVPLWAVGSI